MYTAGSDERALSEVWPQLHTLEPIGRRRRTGGHRSRPLCTWCATVPSSVSSNCRVWTSRLVRLFEQCTPGRVVELQFEVDGLQRLHDFTVGGS